MTDAERLTDAEAKLHLLVTGQMARVYVDQNGERVEYTAARVDTLRKYIAELKAATGSSSSTNFGPLRMIF